MKVKVIGEEAVDGVKKVSSYIVQYPLVTVKKKNQA